MSCKKERLYWATWLYLRLQHSYKASAILRHPPPLPPSHIPMHLPPQTYALRRGESLDFGEYPASQPLHHSPPPPQHEARNSHAPGLDNAYLSRRYAQMARDILSSLPSTCRRLGPEKVKIVNEHPIAAGGFANVLQGILDGRKVVLKSYRCYVSFDVPQVVAVR